METPCTLIQTDSESMEESRDQDTGLKSPWLIQLGLEVRYVLVDPGETLESTNAPTG